jgi:predicted permease
VSRPQAQAEVNVINVRLRREEGHKERRFVALETAGVLPGGPGRMFLGVSSVVMVIAGLVLLIACVNIANLVFARGAARQRELAVRLAIGAGRGQIVRQSIVENLILAFSGAAVGVVLAYAAAKAVASVEFPLPLPIAIDLSPDARVLLATAGIAVVASLLTGVAPAVRLTRLDVNAFLKDGDSASTSFAIRWTRSSLVMAQVTVSVVVLATAALFLHSLWNGLSLDLGFRPENILVVRMDPTAQGYSRKRSVLFFQQIEERVSRLPQVRSASIVAPLPLGIFSSERDFSVPGTNRTLNANLHMVGPQYFATMGIRLIKGRDFHDIATTSPLVAVLSQATADKLFPNQNPLGQQIGWKFGEEEKTYEVIGVVDNTKSKTIGERLRPCLYELAAQNETDIEAFSSFGGISLVVKTTGNPKALLAGVQRQVESLDPGMPIYGAETMEEQVGKSLVVARLAACFLGAFGFVALALAAVGLYGLVSYSVTARTREIAIRMALGATPERTLSMLARQGLTIVGAGLGVGLVASIAVGRLVSSLLYGVGSFDNLTFVTVPCVLSGVAIFAILLPARRATKVDPIVALRYQ